MMLIGLLVFILAISFLGTGFPDWSTTKIVVTCLWFLLWAFIVYSFFNTEYLVSNTELILSVKPFYKKKIAIEKIRRVEKSSSLMSSPAPSFDRLEIFYDKFESELVSPIDQKAFAETLQQINPNIIIKL